MDVKKARCSPDGLICDDDLTPVLDLVCHSLQLLGNNLNRLVGLPLLQALSAAQNYTQATVQRRLGLRCNEVVVFLKDDTALRVTKNCPCDAAVFELISGNLAGKGTAGLVEDVLCGDFESFTEMLAS